MPRVTIRRGFVDTLSSRRFVIRTPLTLGLILASHVFLERHGRYETDCEGEVLRAHMEREGGSENLNLDLKLQYSFQQRQLNPAWAIPPASMFMLHSALRHIRPGEDILMSVLTYVSYYESAKPVHQRKEILQMFLSFLVIINKKKIPGSMNHS